MAKCQGCQKSTTSVYQRIYTNVSKREKDSINRPISIKMLLAILLEISYCFVYLVMPPLKECTYIYSMLCKIFQICVFFQANFEAMFREYESNATFHYLRSFRRVRVDFEAHLAASRAKLELDGTPLGDNVIHCYFLQVSTMYIIHKSISAKK